MSLEKILNKITDDAKAEADRVIQESRQRAEQIKGSARKEASVLTESILKESERRARLEASRIVTQARLERKIDVLSCKQALIDRVMEKAFQNEGLSPQGLKRIIIKKEGQSEEAFDEERLKDELRPRLEKFIADVLKL